MSRRSRLWGRVAWRWLVGGGALLTVAAPAAAQRSDVEVRPPHVEVGGGIGWMGQAEAGTRDATMTSNEGGTPSPFTFFRVSGRTRSGAIGMGWVGVNVTRTIGVEGAFQYSQPELSVKVDGDVESAPGLTFDGSSFTQYLVEGNVLYHFNVARFDQRKTVPFVLGGFGYLRQKDDEGVEEDGNIYQVGLGFKWFSGLTRARAHGLGMRLDVRYVFRDGGFDFEGSQRRSFLTTTASATFGF